MSASNSLPARPHQIEFTQTPPESPAGPGKRKALTIGIDYKRHQKLPQRPGSINDSERLKSFLCRQLGYRQEDVIQLIDNSPNPDQQPTRANVIKAMHRLVKDAQSGDHFFFHFSGYGMQVMDKDGDEIDRRDEILLPVDFPQGGFILDDEMNCIMVKPLPPGCRLTALFDCGHSGSMLDLPYVYTAHGELKQVNPLAEVGQGLLTMSMLVLEPDYLVEGFRIIRRALNGSLDKVQNEARQTRGSEADVVSWSLCQDNQRGCRIVEDEQLIGALTRAFIKALTEKSPQTYVEILAAMRVQPWWYFGKPQLSSSRPLDPTTIFTP